MASRQELGPRRAEQVHRDIGGVLGAERPREAKVVRHVRRIRRGRRRVFLRDVHSRGRGGHVRHVPRRARGIHAGRG